MSVVPANALPRVIDRIANHRLGHAIFMGRITKGKTTFDAGMALVRFTILRRHTNHFGPHFSLEATADTTISTGCCHRVLRYSALDDAVFCQRSRRTGGDTGTATDTV